MAWITPTPARPKHASLRWTRWLFLAIGVAALGYVGFALLDAEIFQAYQDWRLDRAAKTARAPVAPYDTPASAVSVALASQDRSPRANLPRAADSGSTLGRIEI